jgi:hypothetical protein
MNRFICATVLCITGFALPHKQVATAPGEFFPFSAGTYWVYKGTVGWYDYDNDKPASEDVTWKMTVEKVIRKNGVVAAVVTGFPSDLDWTAGTTEAKPWLIIENEKHEVYYENLGPDFDVSKLNGDDHVFDKFMVQDNLFFQWPLRQDAKFCGEEAKGRDDGMYCWVVEQTASKKMDSVKGAPAGEEPVFQLHFRTLPDDTTAEVVPGLGILSYQYHHHGSVADTELQLVEFHPGPERSDVPGHDVPSHDVQGPKP